jgi:uncharacterized membrane protein
MAMSDRVRAIFVEHPHRALVRAILAVAIGLVVAACLPVRVGAAARVLAGWDATAIAMTALSWWLILHCDVRETRHRAASADPGRTAVWGLVLTASAVSLFSTGVVLRMARMLAPEARDLFVIFCLATVVASWVLTHSSYALRYAHLYYRDDEEGVGGLIFPSAGAAPPSPTYQDFAYFAFTVGMCFQVSDVVVSSPQIRRAVLGHALLSFAYNTVILAVALNVVIGLFN